MNEAIPWRTRSLAVICACLLFGLTMPGCDAADPLDVIRERQEVGDFEGSIELLRELLVVQPRHPEANYLYGRGLVATGQLTEATWALRQAMTHPKWLELAAIQLALAGLATGDFNEVVDVTTRILENDPEHVDALLYRAQAHAHWKKEPELALADADRVLSLAPERLEAYEPRILALLAVGQHEEASKALAEVGELLEGPGDARVAWHCSTTAIFAMEGGDTRRAREIWEKCLEAHPADLGVVGNAVRFFDGLAQWDKSLEVLRLAFAEAPSSRAYRTALADRLRQAGELAEAEALLRDATQVDDPRLAAAAWIDLAKLRHAMREHGAAADAMGRAVELVAELEDPNPQLLFEYADALVVSGQLERALEVADEISVPAQQGLIRGRVAQERGNHAAALAAFDEALTVWPNNPWARYYAALAAEQVGDFDRALEEYRYSIRISPGATDARTRAASLLVAQRQPLLAYQLLFLEAGSAPLEPEGELLSMYLMAVVANPAQLQESLLALAARDPARLPAALARAAEGAAERSGPRAAVALLRDAPGIDYRHPGSAPALRALVRFAHEAGIGDLADAVVLSALDAHPEAAVFHEIRGLHLELGRGTPDDARAAYMRAIELAPHHPEALAGLGRLALDREPASAVKWFDQAATVDPSDPALTLGAARAMQVAGHLADAANRLETLLKAHPIDGSAAAELVSIALKRDEVEPRTLDAALRAVRFGGGSESLDQLSEVYARLGRPDEAAMAARRAEILREDDGAKLQPPRGKADSES